MELEKFVYNPGSSGLPSLVTSAVSSKIKKITHGQGYGRHTRDERKLIFH